MKVQHVDEIGPLRHVRDSSMYSVAYLFGGIPPPFPPSLHHALHARAVNLRDVQEPVDRGERQNTVQGMGESYDWGSGQDRFLPQSPNPTQLSLTLSLVVQPFAQRFDLFTGSRNSSPGTAHSVLSYKASLSNKPRTFGTIASHIES